MFVIAAPLDLFVISARFGRESRRKTARRHSERSEESLPSRSPPFVRHSRTRLAGIQAQTEPSEITRPILERYQRYLFYNRKKDGQPLTFRSRHDCLAPLRVWFRWMTRENYTLHNPASELELPKLGYRLPTVLSASEVEQILQ